MRIRRLSVLNKTIEELPVRNLIIHNTLHGIFDVIIDEEIKYVAFSDLHRLRYPSDFLFDSLIPLHDKGFNAIVYEMLPIKSTPYTAIQEIQAFFETGSWCGMTKAICDEITVPEYSIQILSKCLELGIEIWGGDDRSTYTSSSIESRYSMNKNIAKIIKGLVDIGKKVISFYGVEHNNTRTEFHGYMGIPYYITKLDVPFLVIKDLRMLNRDASDYIESLIRENKDKFIGISAIPEVDFPHYLIRYPTSGSGTIGRGGRRKYNTRRRRHKNGKKHRSKHYKYRRYN